MAKKNSTPSTATPNHSARKHSKYAASAAKRWINCHASVELSEGVEQKESDAARAGTHEHEMLELLVRGKMTPTIWSELSPEIRHDVKRAHNVLKKLKPIEGARFLVEQRVNLDHLDPEAFGTLDYSWIWHGEELQVIDYKGGRWVVMPKEENDEMNYQLGYYAVGLAEKFDYKFKRIRLIVIQPKAHSPEEPEPYFEATFTIEELRAYEKKIKAAIEGSKLPNPKHVTGEWCTFCPAQFKCKVYNGEIEDAFGEVQGAVEGFEVPTISKNDPVALGRALDLCKKLEQWIDGVRAQVFILAENGATVDGWKLVAKQGRRKWTGEALKIAMQTLPAEAFTTELLSPAQLEKLGKDFKNFVAQYSLKESSGNSLAPDSDKREAITSTASFEFEVE